MIISKTPFRISLFGGSTDYKSFYSKYESLLVGFAIDKYCYITSRYTPAILPYHTKISYSKIEVVNNNQDIEHDGVRGVLTYLDELSKGVEINHFSDLPSQTGIGSSSSFVVGLLKNWKRDCSRYELADAAIKIERDILKEAGGIQDQIWAAYGGMNSISIKTNGKFQVKPLPVSDAFKDSFLKRSFLIYTGRTRKSYKIASSHNNPNSTDVKKRILDTAYIGYDAFQDEDINQIAGLLHKSWFYKKSISPLVSSVEVDGMYSALIDSGMIGGKLLGSGGSGFIFGIAKNKSAKDRIVKQFGENVVNISISKNGSEIIK